MKDVLPFYLPQACHRLECIYSPTPYRVCHRVCPEGHNWPVEFETALSLGNVKMSRREVDGPKGEDFPELCGSGPAKSISVLWKTLVRIHSRNTRSLNVFAVLIRCDLDL